MFDLQSLREVNGGKDRRKPVDTRPKTATSKAELRAASARRAKLNGGA